MQSASSTPSSRQPASTPTTHSTYSRSSALDGGGNDTPPSGAGFNLPASYPSRPRDAFNAQLRPQPTESGQSVAPHVAESERGAAELHAWFTRTAADRAAREGVSNLRKTVELMNEDRENDPRSRDLSWLAQAADIRPFLVPDMTVSAEALAALAALNPPDGAPSHSDSSTSSTATSAAAAVRQDDAAGGCCLLPSCTIL